MTSAALAPETVERLAGSSPRSLTPIGGGRNSRVFRLETADGRITALKAYFRHPGDSRDRLGVEFGALDFLWEQGVRCVPQPLASDVPAALGLYEFIPGERPSVPCDGEIDAACAFAATLWSLRHAPGAEELPEASEACFSFRALAQSIDARLDRLRSVDAGLAEESGLASFLREELVPAWRMLLEGCRQGCGRAGQSFTELLPLARRTLSPSDFGFHNALRRPGGLVFLDFEYFGWDDPAKLLADFLLHPGMDLTPIQRNRFAAGILECLAVEGLPHRTRLAFPLYGIKWCIILLNEFLQGPLDRRTFADPRGSTARERQSLQLQKSRSKLTQLLDDHAHFSYFPC